MATKESKETRKTGATMWWDYFKSYRPEGYEGYVKQWLDTVENIQDQMLEFNKTLIQRTGQALDESYRFTRQTFDRSVEFINFLHDMTREQIRQWREHL